MTIREYVITYISKEFLQRDGWKIIAYNPPGSQGTFTIPNPDKDGGYRGQTGSLSPDIIALKVTTSKNIFLIVESKPDYEESDVEKMRNMFKNPQRLSLFYTIVKGYMSANDIDYDNSLSNEIYFVKAHGGELNDKLDTSTILISQKSLEWNPKNIDPKKDVYENFEVKFVKLFSEN